MGPTALLPFRRKSCWGFFRPEKIRRFRPGLNPRTWVLKASTQTLDHRSRSRSLISFIYIDTVEVFVCSVYFLQIGALVGGSILLCLTAAWCLASWMAQDSCQRILHGSEHSFGDDVVTCDRWQPYHVILTLHEMLDYVHCLYHLLPVLCSYLLVALRV
jgi:hypothetical protein